ncbi:rhodanese-like domain-containing protein [Micromonospora sp. NPDC005237]|uniref:rhodanese-like domain-containing protein n=1 Tax=Micromonospora sp. NPDC005237 TaxID=3155113 RepID=UPI00339F3306
MQRISRDRLRELLDAGEVTLVEAAHFEADHLPGAVNLPGELSADLAARLAPDRDRTVVTYCSGPACSRSKAAAAAFERLGYTDVRGYDGGKADWAQAGLPFAGTRSTARAS